MSNRSQCHVKSQLLSNQENESVFNVLGKGCFSLATCVAQLYTIQRVRKKHKWIKKCCGAVCFVKDNRKKSYFIRIYDPQSQERLWEQELYTKFKYSTLREFFHTFEAHDCHVGLNFASEDEAAIFKEAIEEKLVERQRKRLEKEKRRQEIENANIISAEQFVKEEETIDAVQVETTETVQPDTIENKPADNVPKMRKKRSTKRKLTKEDVGMPSDFIHVSHMSWNPNDGPHMDRLDSDMKELLEQIGVKERSQVDKDTMEFIYDFVDKHGGVNAVREDFASLRMSEDLSHPLAETTYQPKPALLSLPVGDTQPPTSLAHKSVHVQRPSKVKAPNLAPVIRPPHPAIRPPSPTSRPLHIEKPMIPSLRKQTSIHSKAATSPVKQVTVPPATISTVQQEAVPSVDTLPTNKTVCQTVPQTLSKTTGPSQSLKNASNSAFSLPNVPPTSSPSNQTPALQTAKNPSPGPPTPTITSAPISNATVPPPPAPPLPPPLPVVHTHLPPSNQSRACLLNEIQTFKGTYLNSVTSDQKETDRDVFLREVRTGTLLRHVDKPQGPTSQKRGSIAAALMSELLKRKTVIQFSDTEDISDEFDDDWDD